MSTYPIHTAKFVCLSDTLPPHWRSWFEENVLQDDTPYSWGDNNRTLISVTRFKSFCEKKFKQEWENTTQTGIFPHDEVAYFLAALNNLAGEDEHIYIDLEN